MLAPEKQRATHDTACTAIAFLASRRPEAECLGKAGAVDALVRHTAESTAAGDWTRILPLKALLALGGGSRSSDWHVGNCAFVREIAEHPEVRGPRAGGASVTDHTQHPWEPV